MLSFIGNQFRKPRGFWGRIISFSMKKNNRFPYYKIVQELEIKQNDRVLEIGFGPGIGINMICKNFNCSVTGIDFSELMFREALLRNKRYIDNHKLVLNFGDYLDFKFPVESFDKIFFINVIYFWNNIEKPFIKIKDELKQNGMSYIFMAHPTDLKKLKFTKDDIFNKYTIDYVCDKLKNLGFENIDYKFDNGYYIKCNK